MEQKLLEQKLLEQKLLEQKLLEQKLLEQKIDRRKNLGTKAVRITILIKILFNIYFKVVHISCISYN